MKLSASFVLLFISCVLFSQKVKIKDVQTQEPITEVEIVCSDSKITINFKGEISLQDLCDTFWVIRDGFKPIEISKSQLLDNPVIYIEKDNTQLEPIVVISASRFGKSYENIPQKIDVINKDQVTYLQPQTSADLLRNQPEIFMQKSQMGGGSPMIRGFAANRILLSVDGVRMNNAIFRSGNLQNVLALDPLFVEKVEVSLGPGAVIYGSDAIGGVVNLYTKPNIFNHEKEVKFGGDMVTRYASANNEITNGIKLQFSNNKISNYIAFVYSDFGDLRMGSNGPEDYLRTHYVERIDGQDVMITNKNPNIQKQTAYNQLNFMNKIAWKANENLLFEYALNYSKTSNVPRYDRLIQYRNNNLRSAEWYYGPQIWLMNHVTISYSKSTKIFDYIDVHLALQNFEESRHDRNFNATHKYNLTEKVNFYTANIDFSKSFSSQYQFYYGAEFGHNKVKSYGEEENIDTNTHTPIASRYPDGSSTSQVSLYSLMDVLANSKFTISGGLRYNYTDLKAVFSSEFFDFPFHDAKLHNHSLTGNLGVVYKPSKSTHLKYNFSTGFRSPNIDDIGKIFESTLGYILVPNPALEPEYSINNDVSISKIIASKYKFEVSGFYTFLQDVIVRRNAQLNGNDSIDYAGNRSRVQMLQNGAFAKVYGFTASFQAKLPYQFDWKIQYTHQHGEEELDNGEIDQLRHVAPNFLCTFLTYNTKKWRASLSMEYNAEMPFENLSITEIEKKNIYAKDENGNPYVPSFAIVDFKNTFFINQFLAITSSIENIFDKRYRAYSSGISGPGRNVMVSLKATF